MLSGRCRPYGGRAIAVQCYAAQRFEGAAHAGQRDATAGTLGLSQHPFLPGLWGRSHCCSVWVKKNPSLSTPARKWPTLCVSKPDHMQLCTCPALTNIYKHVDCQPYCSLPVLPPYPGGASTGRTHPLTLLRKGCLSAAVAVSRGGAPGTSANLTWPAASRTIFLGCSRPCRRGSRPDARVSAATTSHTQAGMLKAGGSSTCCRMMQCTPSQGLMG
jgi:hypothetical protein